MADPVLVFPISAVGFFITVAMNAQIFESLLSPTSREKTLLVVLLSSIALGFGSITFFVSFRLFIEIVA